VKPNLNASMKDARGTRGEVVLDPAERFAVGKFGTSSDPKGRLTPFLRLQQLVRAHDGLEEVGTRRI
jgi:hypothetical protein